MTDTPDPTDAPVLPDSPAPRIPAFARDFPRIPELDALVAAFDAGDYARVRAEAPKIAEKSDVPEVRAAAKELRARTEADPLAKVLLGITLGLLVVLSGYWMLHDGPGEGAAPPPPMIERITDTPPRR